MDTNNPNQPNEPAEPDSDGLDYELPASFELRFCKDQVAMFDTLFLALRYAEMEFDSYYVVRVQTGEVVSSKCAYATDD